MAHFLVLAGDGINCERETAWAFEQAGAQVSIVHINDLLQNPSWIHDFDGMAFSGGFSFGDNLGAGQILAIKLRHQMGHELQSFISNGAPIIGICNGFQVLTKLGLLPDFTKKRHMALAPNIHGKFIDCWVQMERPKHAVCKWTQGFEELELPVRHAEGRVVFSRGKEQEIYEELDRRGQIALRYKTDINGSYQNIAAITDPSGLILGLMPHPEAYLYRETHYQKTPTRLLMEEGDGLLIFKNIVQYCKKQDNKEMNHHES